MPDTQNGNWLKRAYPSLAQRVSSFSWIADGLSEAERRAVDELLYLAANDLYTMRAVIDLPWVQASGGPLVHNALRWIKGIAYANPTASLSIVAQPFLGTLERDDVLALWALHRLHARGVLDSLTSHPAFQDGITDAETVRVAAAGTLHKVPAEIERILSPDQYDLEVFDTSTLFTPTLRVSIFRTGTQSRPETVGAIRDAVIFAEDLMRLPLPTNHVIVVLSDEAVKSGFAGTNYGFAFAYSPDYEQPMGTWEQRRFQAGVVHEVAHYYWRGSEDWIDEGLANMLEVMYGVDQGLSRGQLQTKRKDCDAHDLAMLSSWTSHPNDGAGQCDYYLGQLVFEELFDSVGRDEFQERLRTLYPLTLREQESDQRPGIDIIRQLFPDQAEVVEQHWTGKLNAPENRGFDEGYEYTSHNLIQWTQHPTYKNGVVTLEGVFLNGAEPSFRLPRPSGRHYSNFSLRTADDRRFVGSILVPLSGNRSWTLDDPGDVVADTYLIDDASNKFTITFDFPEGLGDNPSDYVVRVMGFQNSEREATIDENIDVLGYARIRVP